MFSLNPTRSSPSLKVPNSIFPKGAPTNSAILVARGKFEFPLNIFIIAGGQGVEPRFYGPKPYVLPLDDPPINLISINRLNYVAVIGL